MVNLLSNPLITSTRIRPIAVPPELILLGLSRLLEPRGGGFRSLAEDIDTTTPAGRLIFHVFAAIAQFERERISERTEEGLEAARNRGRVGGSPFCPLSRST